MIRKLHCGKVSACFVVGLGFMALGCDEKTPLEEEPKPGCAALGQNECNNACQWNGTCIDKPASPLCGSFDRDACSASDACQYDARGVKNPCQPIEQFRVFKCYEFSEDECQRHIGRGCQLKGQQCVATVASAPCDQTSKGRCLQQPAGQCDWNPTLRLCHNNTLRPQVQKLQAETKKLKTELVSQTVTVCQVKEKFDVAKLCDDRTSKGETQCKEGALCTWEKKKPASCKQIDGLCRLLGERQAPPGGQDAAVCNSAQLRVHNNRSFNVQPVGGGAAVAFSNVAQQMCQWSAAANVCEPMYEDLCNAYFMANVPHIGVAGAGHPPAGMTQYDLCVLGAGAAEMAKVRRPAAGGGAPVPKFARNARLRFCEFSPEEPAACVPHVKTNPCEKITGTPDDVKAKCGKTPKTKDLCEVKVHKVLPTK